MKDKNKRKIKVMMPSSGSGSLSPRLSLPTVWVKDMGIDKDDRTVELTYSDGIITIKKLDESNNEVK